MSTDNLRTDPVRLDKSRDPRVRLAREKYFSLRPRPLERWLWAQGISSSAERVFWLHWHEGMKRGDWCSEVPLKRVAAECQLDVSTVTRAYQWLARTGCLRRTDPGRDPHRPFQQATAVTEVRVPRELLQELDRHPNRRACSGGEGAALPEQPAALEPSPPARESLPHPVDPFAGMSGRDRLRALSSLTAALSADERLRYDEACRLRQPHLAFDADSRLSAEEQGRVLQHLAALASAPVIRPARPRASASAPTISAPRRLSVFELARLRRAVQTATSATAAPELMRQVAWSMEEGALRRFATTHALHIALKKIREGAWTRPNRIPPNWVCGARDASAHETCARA